VGGLDHVHIPGGGKTLEPDQPQVPLYTVAVDYAPGYQVQDVTLTQRSAPSTTTGLNLPLVSGDRAGDGPYAAGSTAEPASPGWYPQEDYGWQVVPRGDGSTTLKITVFPFRYNPDTTNVEFYPDWTFGIDYVSSTVEIDLLATDQPAYAQGDEVMVDLWLNNPEEAKDLIVEAVVKAEGSDEVLNGLLLRSLTNLAGPATFSSRWDSGSAEPGYYVVEAAIRDSDSQVLDHETQSFRLGIAAGEITTFAATPSLFDVGDTIDISLVFENTGTLPLTGTATIQVLDEQGEQVQQFDHALAGLAAGGSLRFDDAWDTTGAQEGDYTLAGQVQYEARATELKVITASTETRVYLPAILKGAP
jgi:hypothetical protein